MYHLQLPAHQIVDLYPNCVNRTDNEVLRLSLMAESERVFSRSATYHELAQILQLHRIQEEGAIHVSNADLGNLYDRVLVNGGEYHVYRSIRRNCHFGRCPLCAQRDVRTLDHYLPKSSFPEFAVLPMNLVPCCFDCNHAKWSHSPTALEDQLFHPYFDNWDHLEIIRASIETAEIVYAEFFVDTEHLPDPIAQRAALHFKKLGLASLYSDNASVELVQRREDFWMTFDSGGPDALRMELLREAQSRRAPFPNAWQPTLYRALADSDDFVNGGFLAIEGQPVV